VYTIGQRGLDSKLADAGNPAVRQVGRQRPWADWSPPRVTAVNSCSEGQPRLSLKRQPSLRNEYSNYSATLTEVYRVFPRLQGKHQGIVQRRHGPPFPSRRGPQPKRFQHCSVQLSESYPTKTLLIKGKLPDGIIFHQQQQPLVWEVMDFRMTKNSIRVSTSLRNSVKAPFSTSSNAFRTQEWSNTARDDVARLCLTLPLLGFFVALLPTYHISPDNGSRDNLRCARLQRHSQ
jgi:hypothetical protein